MPLYEYECAKCRRRFERIEKFSGPHLKRCPECGAKVEQLVGAPAIQFKGSGWYVTDYGGKGSAKSEDREVKETKEAKEVKEPKRTKEHGKKPQKEK